MSSGAAGVLGQGSLELDLEGQLELTLAEEPSSTTTADQARQSVDDLVRGAQRYRTSAQYRDLLRFVASFRRYSPYNVVLVDVQKPGATYVLTAARWRDLHRRVVRADAQPLVVLQPRGPVMFVYDVSDTEPLDGAPALPPEVTDPFAVHTGGDDADVRARTDRLLDNLVGLGVGVRTGRLGSQQAGSARVAATGRTLRREHRARGGRRQTVVEHVPLRYEVVLADGLDPRARLVTLAHEAAHVLCGHLGTPDPLWWPDRSGVAPDVEEWEAESVAYLVARRADSAVELPPYLHQHLHADLKPPVFSLERVAKATGDLEAYCTRRFRTAEPGRARPTT
ncbi:ImmA/IrrE family metallo-endopeptidase [uncultured Pseudokineococcus sp.]|uniref:ImmA/IrrE family metallo-endopeptidase n=1 Tax=uncultured Pseudokineococcus sp. TaxID=1642928 RepID=UPI002612A5FC|nr:hypothetical protein [uncultured Pseudokineococcus sp.]